MYKVYELVHEVYKSTLFQGFQLRFENLNYYFLNPRMQNIHYKYYLILHWPYAFFFYPYIFIFINYFNNNL